MSGAQIVQTALQYIGFPYTATGNSPATGFSCIGFASFVYRQNGIPLPGDLGNAIAYAPRVPFSALEPGDLLYFQNTVWNGLSHVAIYIGGGRFVHAEWYGYGVRISSFYNDPRDGNYWPQHYLGANRPWSGAAASPVVNTVVGAVANPTTLGTTALKQVVGGNAATVTVSSLNVRTGPSKGASVRQIVPQGTSLTVVGKQHGWYKVQLPDGSIGWVVAQGIGMPAPTAAVQQQVANPQVANPQVANPQVANPTVGATSAPVRQGATTTRRGTATVRVSALRVHTGPSLDASVVTSVGQGEKVQVLGRSNGWLRVRTPDGAVGWVKAAYTSRGNHPAAPPTPPALNQVKATSPSQSHATRTRAFRSTSYVTSGVRVHAAPGITARVVGMVGAGTHVKVLSYSGGWAFVRLPSGQTGYVYGVYVHR